MVFVRCKLSTTFWISITIAKTSMKYRHCKFGIPVSLTCLVMVLSFAIKLSGCCNCRRIRLRNINPIYYCIWKIDELEWGVLNRIMRLSSMSFETIRHWKSSSFECISLKGDRPMAKISLHLLGKSNLAIPGSCLILQETRAGKS